MTLKSGIESIATERLVLRRFTSEDLEFLVALHSSELVTRYIGHGKPRSRQESETWLSAVLQQYQELEMGQLAVQRKSDGNLIGRCGLWSLYLENAVDRQRFPRAWFFKEQVPTDCSVACVAELGYTFDSAYWSQGYASEAVRGVVDYIYTNKQQLTKIVSLIHPENSRSLRLAAKFNLQLQGHVECYGQQVLQYAWIR